jgi:hypothetical protein
MLYTTTFTENMADRTLIAVSRQVAAMGQSTYEIGLKDEKSQLMMSRTWSREEITNTQNINWLKSMNAQGRHIYIRPVNIEHNLILIDDLKLAEIGKLSEDKLAPAAVVETSPYNYQAWIKLSKEAVTPEKRSWLAQSFAEKYQGDMSSADWRHYGRLAGFTNPKPIHIKENGLRPFVLLDSATGEIARDGGLWVARATEHFENKTHTLVQAAKIEAYKNYHTKHQHNYDNKDALATYQVMAGKILHKYGASTDLSRMDWMIARSMASMGNFSPDQVQDAMLQASPDLTERKASSMDNYVRHTVKKAFALASQTTTRDNMNQQENSQGVQQIGQGDQGRSKG